MEKRQLETEIKRQMQTTEAKLVTLPSHVWDELRNLGYYIPKKGVEYDFIKAMKKVPFQELVYKLSSSQKTILLYSLLTNLDGKKLNTDVLANLAICADENDLVNTANTLVEIFDYMIAKEKNQDSSFKSNTSNYVSKVDKI